MLKTIVETLYTNFSADAATWQDAIYACCRPLSERDVLPENYAKQLIEDSADGAPLVVAPGIAVPQGRLCYQKIEQTCGSLVRLKQPVSFGGKPVDLLFLLAACNHDEHMVLMQRLMEIFENETVVAAVRNAENDEDLMKIWDLVNA